MGNKRTGISVLLIFLAANGYRIDASDADFVATALKIADGALDYSREEFAEWVKARLQPRQFGQEIH